jgi:hypothetical protein
LQAKNGQGTNLKETLWWVIDDSATPCSIAVASPGGLDGAQPNGFGGGLVDADSASRMAYIVNRREGKKPAGCLTRWQPRRR